MSSSHNLYIYVFPTEVECEDDQKFSIFTAASISAVSYPTPLQSVWSQVSVNMYIKIKYHISSVLRDSNSSMTPLA